MYRILVPLLCLTLSSLAAQAQTLLDPGEIPTVNWLFDNKPSTGRLKCAADARPPVLDFALRFDVFYLISCRILQFQSDDLLHLYTRITPTGNGPVFLVEQYRIPQITAEMLPDGDLRKLKKVTIESNAAFMVGEGEYTVEVLLVDQRGRAFRKRWRFAATRRRQEGTVPLAIKPHAVAPFAAPPWEGSLNGDESGLRLTVLLHAIPIDPYSPKLRPWDRSFLLGSLASLLRQIPCQSVRLVAFNLDQQREIFRKEQFDRAGFTELMQALRKTELWTVPYRALQRKKWTELLAKLTREEISAQEPSDVVVFLGPTSHFWEKMPREMLRPGQNESTRFYYFEYYAAFRMGSEFPDAIHNLTKDLHGTVFKIHSADDLGHAIQQLLAQMKQEGQPNPPTRRPTGAF